MTKDDAPYLGHMLEMALKATSRVRDRTRGEFDADEDLRIVLTWLIQVIGEAANRVSRETRDAHPEIPWAQSIGM